MRFAATLDSFLYRVAYPVVAVSAAVLHVYTAYVAFNLAGTAFWSSVTALAAWSMPGIAQVAVACYVWQASDVIARSYLVSLGAWTGLVLSVTVLALLGKHVNSRRSLEPKHDSLTTLIEFGWLD